jgi:hypothetical protein
MTNDVETVDGESTEQEEPKKLGKRARLGVLLIILSFVIWLPIIAVVPFLNIPLKEKGVLAGELLIGSYIAWFLGLFLAGREVARRIAAWFFRLVPWKRKKQEADNDPLAELPGESDATVPDSMSADEIEDHDS